jgi:carbon storage regulator
MLVLARKVGRRLMIGDDIVVTVTEIVGNQVRLGIDAPADVRIRREELLERLQIPDPLPADVPWRGNEAA